MRHAELKLAHFFRQPCVGRGLFKETLDELIYLGVKMEWDMCYVQIH